jgi:hypothetical protein
MSTLSANAKDQEGSVQVAAVVVPAVVVEVVAEVQPIEVLA